MSIPGSVVAGGEEPNPLTPFPLKEGETENNFAPSLWCRQTRGKEESRMIFLTEKSGSVGCL
jgi:hypothetical protein